MTDALKMRAFVFAAILTVLALAFALSGCAGAPPVRDRIVEIKVPVAVQPITPAQVPTVPAPLGPRPGTLPQVADALLGKWCEAVAYFLKADPLLAISAGEKPVDLPLFPECERKVR